MNEFIQLTDSQTEEPVFIAPNEIKSIHQLQADDNYGRRTVINGSFTVKEEATEIALATGRGFIDKESFKPPQYSKIHKRFLRLLEDPRVLTHTQEFLGPNYKAVLDFWLGLDGLSEEQWKTIKSRYDDFFHKPYPERDKARDEAFNASKKTIGRYFDSFAYYAADAVYGYGAGSATRELIGGVKNPAFLPMFDGI